MTLFDADVEGSSSRFVGLNYQSISPKNKQIKSTNVKNYFLCLIEELEGFQNIIASISSPTCAQVPSNFPEGVNGAHNDPSSSYGALVNPFEFLYHILSATAEAFSLQTAPKCLFGSQYLLLCVLLQ